VPTSWSLTVTFTVTGRRLAKDDVLFCRESLAPSLV
jgi:hypothetical protein